MDILSYSEKPMRIIIPSYNNAKLYRKNLDSVFNQNYQNFRVIYCDDASKDETYRLVCKYVQELPVNLKNKIQLLQNVENTKQGYIKYLGAHYCEDDEIMIFLDGDDWLYNNNVLKTVNSYYHRYNTWLTYGSMMEWDGQKIYFKKYSKSFNKKVIEENSYRYQDYFITSHLRTCYAWLYKLIPLEYLLTKSGKFLPFCTDTAEYRSLIEMAGFHHKFIPEPLYVYNRKNSLKYPKTSYQTRRKTKLAIEIRNHIKSMPRLNHLSEELKLGYRLDLPINIDGIVEKIDCNGSLTDFLNTIESLSGDKFYLIGELPASKLELAIRYMVNLNIDTFLFGVEIKHPKYSIELSDDISFFRTIDTYRQNFNGIYTINGLRKLARPTITMNFNQRISLGYLRLI